MNIGIVGAGKMARALGRRLFACGHPVMVSSRQPHTSEELAAAIGGVRNGSFGDAARFGDVVILAVNHHGALPALAAIGPAALEGKVLIDCNNPVDPPDYETPYGMQGSLAEDIAKAAPGARVVKAFNSIYAEVIEADPPRVGGCPVTMFVAGDDPLAVDIAGQLGTELGFTVVEVGGLRRARHLEALTATNILMGSDRGLAPYVALNLAAGPPAAAMH